MSGCGRQFQRFTCHKVVTETGVFGTLKLASVARPESVTYKLGAG